MLSRAQDALRVNLPLQTIFELPTIAGLAALIEQSMTAEQLEQSAPIEGLSADYSLPLSFAQQRLWFLTQLDPETSLYNMSASVLLKGSLNIEALERSLNEIIRRHESLRTVFPTVDGQPIQSILPSLTLQLIPVDLSHLSTAERQSRHKELCRAEAQQTFDLQQGPLIKVKLLRFEAEEHVLLLTKHHIISDGWSIGVLMNEMAVLYSAYVKGEESPLDELPIQYGDFAVWQRQWLQADALSDQLSYWHDQLADAPSLLELPTDRPRPPSQSYSGATSTLMLSSHLNEAIKKLSREQGCTPFMTLLAAFKVLLMRYTHQHDIVVGTPIANRRREELEGLIGYFANTLALRTKVEGGMSFKALMGRVKEVALGGYGNQDVPFEKVVERMKPERTMSYSPIFQVMFVMQNSAQRLRLEGLTLNLVNLDNGTSKFDLTMEAEETEEGLKLNLEYSTDLFDEERIRRMGEHYQTLLESAIANPDSFVNHLQIIPPRELHQLLSIWNDTSAHYEHEVCMHHLFERTAQQHPNDIAIVDGSRTFSYLELNTRANQLARYLKKMRLHREELVGLCLDRSAET